MLKQSSPWPFGVLSQLAKRLYSLGVPMLKETFGHAKTAPLVQVNVEPELDHPVVAEPDGADP